MTYWVLVALAVGVSFLSLFRVNLLLSLGGFAMWMILMAYNLAFPLTNVTQGDTIHEMMTLGFIALALATLLAWYKNRGRTESSSRISMGDGEILARGSTQTGVTPNQSLMRMSPEEYKAYLRTRMRRRGR